MAMQLWWGDSRNTFAQLLSTALGPALQRPCWDTLRLQSTWRGSVSEVNHNRNTTTAEGVEWAKSQGPRAGVGQL